MCLIGRSTKITYQWPFSIAMWQSLQGESHQVPSKITMFLWFSYGFPWVSRGVSPWRSVSFRILGFSDRKTGSPWGPPPQSVWSWERDGVDWIHWMSESYFSQKVWLFNCSIALIGLIGLNRLIRLIALIGLTVKYQWSMMARTDAINQSSMFK